MRAPILILLAFAAACGPTVFPAVGAPKPDTRLGLHDTFEALLLSTNSRVIPTRDPLPGTPAALWPALPQAYAALGLAIAHLDTTTMVVGNPGFAARRELAGQRLSMWLDCGNTATGVPITDRYAVTVQIFTQLAPSASGTDVRSVLTGRALNPTTNDPPVDCMSTGRLEKRIVAALLAAA
ncbi:MAG: hypothetical protein KY444_02510 [Gemmatimonadetes bacterium]|nr:hypothetical protein [Gemmatimonadota bacterium]